MPRTWKSNFPEPGEQPFFEKDLKSTERFLFGAPALFPSDGLRRPLALLPRGPWMPIQTKCWVNYSIHGPPPGRR